MVQFLSEGIKMEIEKSPYLYNVISGLWEIKSGQCILGLFFTVVFTGYFFSLFYFVISIISPST